MRHKVSGKRLGRHQGARKALRRNLIKQLFEFERIRTTKAKARAVRPEAEKLITLAKRAHLAVEAADAARENGDEELARAENGKAVHARRLAASRLDDPFVVQILFDEIAPRYVDRPGGYTRIFKLGPRYSDSAEMVILELVE